MARITLIAILAYTLGSNLWAYPTVDGVSFGLGQFGYHIAYND